MPWQWQELCDRCGWVEIERVIDGAIWREAVRRDRLAVQTAALLNIQLKKDDHVTLRDLLGREPIDLDPRPRRQGPVDGSPETDPETAAAMSEAQAAGLSAIGIGQMGTLSQEEFDRAWDEAQVSG